MIQTNNLRSVDELDTLIGGRAPDGTPDQASGGGTTLATPQASASITILGKPGCPDCLKCKQTMESIWNIDATYLDCGVFYETEETKLMFREKMRQYVQENVPLSFPFVFVNNRYVGGYRALIGHVSKIADDEW